MYSELVWDAVYYIIREEERERKMASAEEQHCTYYIHNIIK